MNKVISLLTILSLSTPAIAAGAAEYKTDSYDKYGYAAGAAVFGGSELKGGLRGAHVAANHHRENSYYPGYIAVPVKKDK